MLPFKGKPPTSFPRLHCRTTGLTPENLCPPTTCNVHTRPPTTTGVQQYPFMSANDVQCPYIYVRQRLPVSSTAVHACLSTPTCVQQYPSYVYMSVNDYRCPALSIYVRQRLPLHFGLSLLSTEFSSETGGRRFHHFAWGFNRKWHSAAEKRLHFSEPDPPGTCVCKCPSMGILRTHNR